MVPTKNVHSAYDERALTCCTMCQKVHPTPSTCVSDRTPNDHLTLNSTQTFELRLTNDHQWPDQLICIHSDVSPINTPPLLRLFRVSRHKAGVRLLRACEAILGRGKHFCINELMPLPKTLSFLVVTLSAYLYSF